MIQVTEKETRETDHEAREYCHFLVNQMPNSRAAKKPLLNF